ncbi:MAG: glycosyl hydrolase family 8 [Polyangiaceae bacterium]
MALRIAYTSWKNAFVTSSGAGGGLRVKRPGSTADDTVSEGIAYGMLAAAYMNDRPTFDGLWLYARNHFDNNKLMHWQINADGSVKSMGSATDADEDMAWALLVAFRQFADGSYLVAAKAMIDAMYSTEIGSDGMLKPGDGWGNTLETYPDYFSPAYFRVFATVSDNSNWSGAILDRNYAILKAVTGTYGLVPDKTTSTYQIATKYSYDACRTPWRIAMDYCFNGEPRAKEYLDKIGPFFNNIGATNIVDGYDPASGSPTGGPKNMAFIGPAGVAGMAGWPSLLDGAYNYGVSGGGSDTVVLRAVAARDHHADDERQLHRHFEVSRWLLTVASPRNCRSTRAARITPQDPL